MPAAEPQARIAAVEQLMKYVGERATDEPRFWTADEVQQFIGLDEAAAEQVAKVGGTIAAPSERPAIGPPPDDAEGDALEV